MKAKLIVIAVAGVLLGTLAVAPPAEAGHLDWGFGVGFHVGGLHFRIGLSPAGYGGYPGPFFLTTSPLRHPGYSCNGACFRRGAGFYHHASCPLLSFHLGRGGYGPDHYVRSYSPYGSYRGYGSSYGRYPGQSNGRYYYRDGYRNHYRPNGHRYRDQRRSGRHDGRGYRNDRGRGRDYGHNRDGDRGRQYRGDRHQGDRSGGRDHAQPRRGASRTRPPR